MTTLNIQSFAEWKTQIRKGVWWTNNHWNPEKKGRIDQQIAELRKQISELQTAKKAIKNAKLDLSKKAYDNFADNCIQDATKRGWTYTIGGK